MGRFTGEWDSLAQGAVGDAARGVRDGGPTEITRPAGVRWRFTVNNGNFMATRTLHGRRWAGCSACGFESWSERCKRWHSACNPIEM